MTGTEFTTVNLWIAEDREPNLAEVLGSHATLGSMLGSVFEGRVEATIYLDSSQEPVIPSLLQDLEGLACSELRVGTLPGQDWLKAYRERVKPFSLGRTWWIDPHPQMPSQAPKGRLRLVIEPRMAFGTGSHESTHLVLLELEDDPPEGLSVMDIGTGSGILALAAERLGAVRTVGLDIDLQAVIVARQIVADQDFACSPGYLAGPLAAVGRGEFSLVLCNMISEHFRPLIAGIRRIMTAEGTAVFSGVLAKEAEEVSLALEKGGLRVEKTRHLHDWVALRVRRG
ncbi:MAG: 50S ribosomal protein L11 methyltransferase [Thermoanaerobaculales bacterium]|nr:50S ribosomal protein L11 methyltransferase [Thermoanaerobaculales bacterium]